VLRLPWEGGYSSPTDSDWEGLKIAVAVIYAWTWRVSDELRGAFEKQATSPTSERSENAVVFVKEVLLTNVCFMDSTQASILSELHKCLLVVSFSLSLFSIACLKHPRCLLTLYNSALSYTVKALCIVIWF